MRLGWLDLVFGDLEDQGYACGAAVFGAHSVGAPHIRQRLYWVADADLEARSGRGVQRPGQGDGEGAGSARERPAGLRADGRLADACVPRLEGSDGRTLGDERATAERGRGVERLADAHPPGLGVIGGSGLLDGERQALRDDANGRGGDLWSSATAGFWRDPDWLACRDGLWRPVESGTFPLVDGAPARVGRLRGYGNGLVAPQAAAFVRAYLTRP